MMRVDEPAFHLPLDFSPLLPFPYGSLPVNHVIGNFLKTCFYLGNCKGLEPFFEGLKIVGRSSCIAQEDQLGAL